MEYFAKKYDVAVIGAGHAGIEAALAAARLGASTVVFSKKLTLSAVKWAKRQIKLRFRQEC